MNLRDSSFAGLPDHRNGRQHRYMESADINAAFRELFGPLRSNIRRGMSSEGQLYAIEMDSCIPGELLGTVWIPPSARGIVDAARLADDEVRRAVFDNLFSEQRVEALFAYLCERRVARGRLVLYLEIASVDGRFAAEYPICAGRGWYRRELVEAPHRRLDPVAHA